MTQADISEELPDYIDTDDMDEEGGDEGGQLYEHYRVVADKGQQLLRVDKFLLDHLKDTSRNRIEQLPCKTIRRGNPAARPSALRKQD